MVSKVVFSISRHFWIIFGAGRQIPQVSPSSSSPSLHREGQGKGRHPAAPVEGRHAAHKVPSLGISSGETWRGHGSGVNPLDKKFPVVLM